MSEKWVTGRLKVGFQSHREVGREVVVMTSEKPISEDLFKLA